jgi:hypothetical protein
MGFLGEISALGGVLKSATGLVRELKRPRLSDESFEELLRDQMKLQAEVNKSQASGAGMVTRAEQWSTAYRARMDADGDGLLSEGESGLSQDVFRSLDSDGDGKLSGAELQAAALKTLLQQQRQG